MWESSGRLVLLSFSADLSTQHFHKGTRPKRSDWLLMFSFHVWYHSSYLLCLPSRILTMCVFSLSELFVSFHPMKYLLHLVRCTWGWYTWKRGMWRRGTWMRAGMTGTTSINLSPDRNHPSICLYKHKSANWRLTFYISFFLFHQSEFNTVIYIEGITMTPSMSYIYFNNHQNSMEYSFYEAIIFPFPCVKYDTIIFTHDWIQFLPNRNNNSLHDGK